jgi:pantoate--beta-alanine ligase
VATVVAKLFNMVQPHLAIFGEKDYQQLAVIRQMVRDLNFNVEICGHPIVREADGLAMSSRNSYLSDEERRNALCLHTSILHARELVANSSSKLSVRQLTGEVAQIITTTPGCTVDYIAVVDKDSLLPLEIVERNSLLALAVKVNNRVRLIDNSLLFPDS